MREMDDNNHSKSDNVDTQRLYLKVTLRVVSTVSPRDRTVTQLLDNKPITDEITAHIALAVTDLIHIAPLPLQGLCNGLITKREDVIRRFFGTITTITCLAVHTPTPSPSSMRSRTTSHKNPNHAAALLTVRTATALQPKYAAALAALTTSADPLTSTEAIRLLGTSALGSPLPAATCLATLEAGAAGDVPIDAVITALNAFPTAGLFCTTTSPCKDVAQRWEEEAC